MATSDVIERERPYAGVTVDQRRRRASDGWVRGIGIATVALLVGFAAGWAGTTVLAPPQQVLEAEAFSAVAVVPGEVGSSITLNSIASWATSPVAVNGAAGIVTSVDITAGASVERGQRLYSVNLRPVVAGQGEIPAYGPISPGDAGAQVSQLQQLMTDLGFWRGAINGRYTAPFATAVRNWQRASGYPVDGVVQAGDIVWVPQLPARMSFDGDTIATGRVVAAGEGDVVALGSAPTFTIPLQRAQTRLAPTGTRVIVQAPDGSLWDAVAGAHTVDPMSSETVHVALAAPDDGPVCADTCDLIGAEGQATLLSEVVTVPPLAGLVVPASAITTGVDGRAFVTDAEGAQHEVTVVQSARGMALIEGVAEGLEVRIPAAQGQ
ncbi:peptidoglycan-binding domain-containing protein [Agrococcus sp. Marseille-Q4369]|uniref:peptidoglycan-binding domain-containing protein n=1 Tax=Agrococcus sp. Marseille-Q4369 TaxID=2810513 RepID=UPI001B8D38D6|nr:peptidoglycan-binding domain-containing protein [Agrococcus sp. Marseille-Q4369]QUW18646.1 peptidoglycan-binding protein [Agrococcus sp. Marseille-Q4369]